MPITKMPLSGSTDGRGIKVAATSSPGTTIHTGPSDAAHIDEIWLWAVNTDTATRTITVQWGGTTSPDDEITVSLLPVAAGPIPIVVGFPIKGNATALVVKAYADVANKVIVHGYVNAIT